MGRKRTGRSGSWYTPVGRNACGKYAFPSKKLAKAAARRNHPDDNKLGPYLCVVCELYHLGHTPLPVLLGMCSSRDWQLLNGRQKTELVRQALVNLQLQGGEEEWDVTLGSPLAPAGGPSDEIPETTSPDAAAAAG